MKIVNAGFKIEEMPGPAALEQRMIDPVAAMEKVGAEIKGEEG
ncbi:MAG: hypothetical protein SVS15_06170 [Thermodesulfobacteriota bacterium]|nr:hypothetical protein [Thermodesulfobacteriota bacterium]